MAALLPTRRFTAPSLWRDIDEFENRLRRLFGEPATPVEDIGWTPSVDVVETDEEIKLTAELPGMDLEDIDVEVEANVLRIQGEKKEEKEEERENGGRKYRMWERSYGEFSRSFTLPSSVDADEIDAEFEKGVLTVHMPKTEVARGRQIEVQQKK